MELHLSHDELLVFLTIIGVPTMNGLEDDPLEGLDERVIAERLNSGEQSLINRGLLVIDENSVTLDDTLVALVGSSVAPDATFLLTRIEPDGSNEVHYFNVTSEITVEHYSPKAGIYRFTYIPDDEALTARLHTLLEPLSSAPEPPAEKIFHRPLSADAMTRFMQQCQEGATVEALQILVSAGWSQEAARPLVDAHISRPTWVGATAWHLRSGAPSSLGPLMIFQGEDRCWLATNMEDSPNEVLFQVTSGEQCSAALLAMAEPLHSNSRN